MKDDKKKKKKPVSFLQSLERDKKSKESAWKGKAGSYLESKKSKRKKLDKAFDY